ncbi:MAG: hypothetical protein II410_04875 [Ruminococcus sp.]|jgi:capsular polysaccharide biosynthesis protein|uniref:YveK family protein n=1 Tax=Ruminococcus sp. JE7B6 TaxID=3233380 RepID=UPI00292FB275|nr:Wzz/FepE/Etk N-terminal domain-containing protein [uncultured Ruminococcus sp.]MBQ2212207.1 hypothetical protein [Ruminococcus sp.]MBQ4172862.1 hypothetical protein [Ruminococcus sp.]MBQ5763414.1 hypothetical protein [Ruminococcus sp.]
MEEKEEAVLSFKDILGVLRKNLIFIIITCLVFSLGSFFVTNFLVTKHYTSTISLYVETVDLQPDSQNSAIYSLNMQNYALKLVNTYIRMLDTNTFYTKLATELNDKYTPDELSKMISYKSDETTEVFDVSVVSESPTESKVIADTIAEVAPETISNLKSNAKLKVCDEAQLPTKPSSPSLSRNVIIAFAIGLLLALVVSFIRHFLDKKIKYDDEMTTILDIPVLAAIPSFDTYINQKGKNGGAKDNGK